MTLCVCVCVLTMPANATLPRFSQSLEKEEISEREMEKKELPEFRAGDVLAVTLVGPQPPAAR